jgi:NAD(P)-dependent dehydrogenase (short-subunit alcohol dehydrogenase family)
MSKIVLITGASRGIGAATALLAAKSGWDIAVNYTSDETAAQRVAQQVRAFGQRSVVVQANVGNENDVLRMFETIDQELGTLSALVNNAGIVAPRARVVEMSAQRLEKMFATNITGSFLCAREAVKRMLDPAKQSSQPCQGRIVNVSSIAARLGSPFEFVDYAASKAAIDAFTIGLAKEVADQGIRVNAVRPGLIYTDIHASCGAPDRVDQMSGLVPMKRGGTADEVAQAVMWLLSDASSYVTGSFIDVSGGR